MPLIQLEETTSTNVYLKELCRQPMKEFTTVVARFQTAGRGQRGNFWESEPGQNLLFSFVLYPDFLEARLQFALSQIVSLAVKDTLEMFTSEITVKWPNDIYWRDKKIAGILIENDLQGNVLKQSIVGIGININQQAFHSPAPNPVSLSQITGSEHRPLVILRLIMRRVQEYYPYLRSGETALIQEIYQEALFRREGLYSYRDKDGEFEAEFVRVEPEGRLILRDKSGTERGFMFKEVEYSLI